MAFKRTKEDFICEHCGTQVSGNGYTNHCPKCLWSKHVDKDPGDRAEICGGMMRPTKVEMNQGEFTLTHTCEKCGTVRTNKSVAEDNTEEMIRIANNNAN